MMLIFFISDAKQSIYDIDVYLEPFDWWFEGYFNLKVVLLLTINDFPTWGNLLNHVTLGYKTCLVSSDDTDTIYLPMGRWSLTLDRGIFTYKSQISKTKVKF